MPKLPELKLTTVTLPVSGITCQLSCVYGDNLAIQAAMLGNEGQEVEDESDVPPPLRKTKKKANKLTGPQLLAYNRIIVERCVKSWDCDEPFCFENVERLDPKDGSFLTEAISALVNPTVSVPKGESTPTS